MEHAVMIVVLVVVVAVIGAAILRHERPGLYDELRDRLAGIFGRR